MLAKPLALLESHPHYEDAMVLAGRLRESGFQVLFAGGCVRDALLGHMPKDLDFATSARPEDIERLFEKTLAVGKAFGTMVVVINQSHFEVTTFRKDLPYVDGRHPSGVVFSDAEEDAKRRDFTINALFYDPFEHKTLDYVGGISDLKAQVLRTVGDAKERFDEDHLRLLRAVRFSSQLGFDIEIKTWNAILESAATIASVSKERVFHELLKLLQGRFPVPGLERLVRSGLAKEVFPSLEELHNDKVLWKKFVDHAKWLRSPEAFFAAIALFAKNREGVYRDLERLKPPRQLIPVIKKLVQSHESLWKEEAKKSDRIRFWASAEWQWILELSAATARTEPLGARKLDAWIAEFLAVCDQKGNLPKPYLDGEDLLKMGFVPGPQLGKTLEEIYSLQLEGQISSIAQAKELAKNRLAETSSAV